MQSLLKEYHELPHLEKRILQIKSLCRANISKADFLKVLNHSDLKTFFGKSFDNTNLTTIFQNLINKKLLQPNNVVNNTILHQIAIDTATGKYSASNVNILLDASYIVN